MKRADGLPISASWAFQKLEEEKNDFRSVGTIIPKVFVQLEN